MDPWSSHIFVRKTIHYFFPSLSTIHCPVKRCVFTSVVKSPRLSSKCPHSSIHNPRIICFHCNVSAACIFVNVEDFFPCLSSIYCFKDPSFFIWTPFFPKCAYTSDIRIFRIYDYSFYSFGIF